MNKKCREKWEMEEINIDETEDCNLKHCSPQHRQYLSYDGIGSGTIFQREKQFTKYKAAHAAESLMNHRMKKITTEISDKALVPKKHDIKTKYGYERVVEDLIQQAMKKGEFNNLKGCGKPLPCISDSCNPYVDFVTHKLNQVLLDNGFTPEWIMLQKEIRIEEKNLKRNLYRDRTNFGEYPLNEDESRKWDTLLTKYQKEVNEINKKITKYNLVVPALQTQKLQVSLQKISDKILKYGQTKNDVALKHKNVGDPQTHPKNIFSFIESFVLKNRRY